MKIETIARCCHEINRALCEVQGDASHLPWDESSEEHKESIRKGVQYTLDYPNLGPQSNHESWLAQKQADGWVYGPVKDIEKKQHPCMLPYKQLPIGQQIKDQLFRTQVLTMRDAFLAEGGTI